MPTLLRLLPLLISRTMCAGFAVIAALSIPEARQLLKGSYEQQGDVLYIPLTICEPSGIMLNGEYVSLDSENTVEVDEGVEDVDPVVENVTTTTTATDAITSNATSRFLHSDEFHARDCHTLDFLVNACAMSFVFSIGAIAIFFVADMLIRRGIGVPGAVVGMGLFLVFILLQTAVCTWALVSESRYWTDYFEDIVDDSRFAEYGIDSVETYGNTWMLMATGAAALACSVLLILEAFVSFCCRSEQKRGPNDVVTEEISQKDSLPAVESTDITSTSRDYSNSEDATPYQEETAPSEDAAVKQPSWAMNTYANPFYHW